MKHKKFWIAALIITTIVACTKEMNTQLGGELIPPVDGINVKDTTIDVFGKTWGSNAASIPITEVNVLGNINSTVFGKIKAGINIQMQPVIDSFRFPVGKDSLQLDSVVVVLGTAGIAYGDSTQNLAFRVYEIASSANFGLKNDYPYATTTQFAHGAELTYNNVPKVIDPKTANDSVYNFLDTTARQLRIRLSDNFGNKLLKDYTFDHEYQSDSTFLAAFKGLQILPENTGNALIPVVFTNKNTKLAIYFKYTKRDGSGIDTAVTYLRPNSLSASSNYIERDRTGTPLDAVFPKGNVDSSDQFLYVEAAPGVYSRVAIPALAQFPKSLLYKAELVLTQTPDPNDVIGKDFIAPNLYVAAYDSANHRRLNLSKDAPATALRYTYVTGSGGVAALGGNPTKVPNINVPGDSVLQYRINITHQVQDVLTGKSPNLPLDIFAPAAQDSVYDATIAKYIYIGNASSGGAFTPLNFPGVGRIQFGGTTNNTNKIQLHIVYSPIKN